MNSLYTLEEAARVLGLTLDQLRVEAENQTISAFLEGDNWRFHRDEVNDLARRNASEISESDLNRGDKSLLNPVESYGKPVLEETGFHPNLDPVSLAGTHRSDDRRNFSHSDREKLFDQDSPPHDLNPGSSSEFLGWGQEGVHPGDSSLHLPSSDQFDGTGEKLELIEGDSSAERNFVFDGALPPVARNPMLDSSAISPALPDENGFSGLGDAPDFIQHDNEYDDSASFHAAPPSQNSMLDSSADLPALAEQFEFDSAEQLIAQSPDSASDFELTLADDSRDYGPTSTQRPSTPGLMDSVIVPCEGSNSGDSLDLAPLDHLEIGRFSKGPDPSAETGFLASIDDDESPDPSAETGFHAGIVDDEDKTVQIESTSDFELEEADSISEVFAIDEDQVDQNSATSLSNTPSLEDEDESAFLGDDSEDDESDENLPVNPKTAAELLKHREARAHRQRLVTDPEPSAPRRMIASAPEATWGTASFSLVTATAMMLLLCSFFAIDLASNFGGATDRSVTFGLVKQFARLVGL